ncbi:MAG: alanine racemase, partial [Gemmatimonadetes bacterium]|nr:alanine racemase [Gemmatimonadota bacterium]
MTALRFPQHAPHALFTCRDDCLLIGDRPLTELREQVGRTPFYAYDRTLISQRIAELRRALPPDVRLHYAVKANPMPELARFVARLVDGLDVASAGELQVALDAGMRAASISIAGPGKSPAELARAVAAGVVVNLESVGEMRRLARIAREAGTRAAVAVRGWLRTVLARYLDTSPADLRFDYG